MKGLVDRRAGDLAVKERVVQHLIGDLGRISDPLLQELYSKELCRSFGLTESTVTTALRQRKAPGPGRRDTPEAATAAAEQTASEPARLQEARSGLLRLGLTSPQWGAQLIEEFEPEDFSPGPERRVFEAMRRAGDEGRWRDCVESSEDDSFGTAIEIQGPLPGDPERLYQDYRTCLIENRFEAVKAELERQMSEAESRGDDAMVRRLIEARQALAQDRRSLRDSTTRQGDAGGGS
jgi:DNA primase